MTQATVSQQEEREGEQEGEAQGGQGGAQNHVLTLNQQPFLLTYQK